MQIPANPKSHDWVDYPLAFIVIKMLIVSEKKGDSTCV
jgi:hypothetical protein